ncbi:MAG: tetratricopeptide repeat protein [Steroidobacteraceae bacterium]
MSLIPDRNTDKLGRAALSLQSGEIAAAEQLYREVLEERPGNAVALQQLGMLALQRGDPQTALTRANQWRVVAPANPFAHTLAGMALAALGRRDDALAAFEAVLRQSPDFIPALAETGRLQVMLGRLQPALATYARLLALEPRHADAHNGRGVALRGLRRYSEALASFAEALRAHPEHVAAMNNTALTLHDANRSEEAIVHLRRAVALQPQHRPSLHNLGMILHSIDRHDEAAQCYARLLDIAPEFDYAAGDLARARLACCDWRSFQPDVQRIIDLTARGVHAADALTALMVTGSAQLQLTCARRFAARQYPAHPVPLWRGERYRHDRIRIAYLSADFHDHPVAHLLAGVIEHHDRRQFETIGVSLRREASAGAMHARLRQAFEQFLDVAELDDQEVAARLRALEVDIAVDLTGFTRGGRLGILAWRPAPVQVNYLGFAGSYGAPYIDYMIADHGVIPAGEEHHYSERLVRLPHTFLPNDDNQPIAGDALQRPAFGLPDTGFVFCAFSNAYKITPPVFDMWMRLLLDTPGSVLWLRSGPPATVSNLVREASARGVAPERLAFAPRIACMDRHLARYRLADLFLDTSPYGAHATARDALWAGLPVLTHAGDAFASRVAASLLSALDLSELMTGSLDDYYAQAQRLAHSPALLAQLRERLAQRRLKQPPFDTALYCRHLESAYRSMWERCRRGDAPAPIDVAALG